MIFPDTPPEATVELEIDFSESSSVSSALLSSELSSNPSASSSLDSVRDFSQGEPGCSTSTPRSTVPAKKRKTHSMSEQMTKLTTIIESKSETHKIFVQKSLENDDKIISAINELVSALKR